MDDIKHAAQISVLSGAFVWNISRRDRKITESFWLRHVGPPARMQQFGYNWTNFHGVLCLMILPPSENLLRYVEFDENLTKMAGTVHEGLSTFIIISHWILLRTRNVADKRFRGIQNTHFMWNAFSPKIVSSVRYCGKIWWRQTSHR